MFRQKNPDQRFMDNSNGTPFCLTQEENESKSVYIYNNSLGAIVHQRPADDPNQTHQRATMFFVENLVQKEAIRRETEEYAYKTRTRPMKWPSQPRRKQVNADKKSRANSRQLHCCPSIKRDRVSTAFSSELFRYASESILHRWPQRTRRSPLYQLLHLQPARVRFHSSEDNIH